MHSSKRKKNAIGLKGSTKKEKNASPPAGKVSLVHLRGTCQRMLARKTGKKKGVSGKKRFILSSQGAGTRKGR